MRPVAAGAMMARAMPHASPENAERPLVLALDLGTSSARAVLYDRQGRLLEGAESRFEYVMTATPDGGVEIEADRLLEILSLVIDELLERARALIPDLASALGGVGGCTFWHSVLGVDDLGRALTPLYNWNDTRSAPDATLLDEKLGRDWLHSRTGCVPHASYYPAKIAWLRRTRPNLASAVNRWVSIGEYFYERLFGRTTCGISMASGTGLFNPNTCTWDEEVLAALEIGPERLSPIAEPRETFSGLNRDYAARWPELAHLPWHPLIGDGAASNTGSGCVMRDAIAINVGTSGAMRVCWKANAVRIPRGLWCYRTDDEYLVMGGALSNGGDVFAWCRKTLRLDADEVEEEDLARLAPDGHGLTILPFFSGERSTGWADYARAAVVGMNLGTQPVDILRASLEAVAYRFAAIYDRLREELPAGARIIASGGGILRSRVWTQMMADVIGLPVIASTAPEASSRGAAIVALKAFGIIPDLDSPPALLGEEFEPDPDAHKRYRRGRARQQRLYELLVAPGPEVLS
ncbi:MAG: gluconokinase [Blastocatellales bacterium]|nr:gluconokinase [Blastocatellales bacterium]